MSAFLLLKIRLPERGAPPTAMPVVIGAHIYSEESPTCYSRERFLLIDKIVEPGLSFSDAEKKLRERCRKEPYFSWAIDLMENEKTLNEEQITQMRQEIDKTLKGCDSRPRPKRKTALAKRSR